MRRGSRRLTNSASFNKPPTGRQGFLRDTDLHDEGGRGRSGLLRHVRSRPVDPAMRRATTTALLLIVATAALPTCAAVASRAPSVTERAGLAQAMKVPRRCLK